MLEPFKKVRLDLSKAPKRVPDNVYNDPPGILPREAEFDSYLPKSLTYVFAVGAGICRGYMQLPSEKEIAEWLLNEVCRGGYSFACVSR